MKKIFATISIVMIATFAFTQTKTVLKPADLPKKVTDYIGQNMKGFTIEKAYKMENKGEMSYAVIVMKGTERHKMHFDKDGIYIKVAAPPEGKKTEAPPATKAKVPKKGNPVAPPQPAGDQKPEAK